MLTFGIKCTAASVLTANNNDNENEKAAIDVNYSVLLHVTGSSYMYMYLFSPAKHIYQNYKFSYDENNK